MFEKIMKNVLVGTVGTFVTDRTTRTECDTIINTTKEIINNVKNK